MSNDEKKRLTIEDPVPREVLAEFQEIREAQLRLAEQNMFLDREKVRLLAANNKLDQQQQRLFETILVDRGIAPGTPVELDAGSGKLTLKGEGLQKAEPKA
jgi:hypothetical protein